MKSIINLTILLSFIFTPLFSQKHTIKLSKELKLERKVLFTKHLHSDSTGHYLQFGKYKSLFFGSDFTPIIKKFDKNFKEIFSKEYKTSKDDVINLGIRYIKNKFVWLYYTRDKKKKVFKIYGSTIDLNGKVNKPVKFASYKYTKKHDYFNFQWKLSQDTTKIMFVAESDDDKKKKKYEAHICVLDSNLSKIWEKSIKMNASQKKK